MNKMQEDVQRSILWEEAKGKLRAILASYYQDERYMEIDNAITNFIADVEDNAWGGLG